MCTLNVQNWVCSLKNCVCECIEIYTFFEKLCTLNVQNWLHILKNVYIKCTELYTFFGTLNIELCTLNTHNCIYSLKICMCWMYNIVYIIWKIVYVKYTELWTFLKKLCTLNVHSMKDCVYCLKNGFFNCTE